jgi:hypothetical protein
MLLREEEQYLFDVEGVNLDHVVGKADEPGGVINLGRG